MTVADPRRQPPAGPKLSLSMVGAIVVALAIGGLFQEVRWRGGFSSIVPSPIQSSAQQLKLGKLAFANGNDAVALNLFERLAAENNAAAQYWLAHMSELGVGAPKERFA